MDANLATKSSSNGFAKRAFATVAFQPCIAKSSVAIRHSLRQAPRDSMAKWDPWRRITPFPIGRGAPLSGIADPTPSPRGYRMAAGRSFISTAVATISTNSASSEAAITQKLGNVDRYVMSYEPA